MRQHESLESLARQAPELGVTQGDDRSVARLAGDEGHFAHGLAGHDSADEPTVSLEGSGVSAETTARDAIESVGFAAGFEQRCAARQGEPLDLAYDRIEQLVVEALENGER